MNKRLCRSRNGGKQGSKTLSPMEGKRPERKEMGKSEAAREGLRCPSVKDGGRRLPADRGKASGGGSNTWEGICCKLFLHPFK